MLIAVAENSRTNRRLAKTEPDVDEATATSAIGTAWPYAEEVTDGVNGVCTGRLARPGEECGNQTAPHEVPRTQERTTTRLGDAWA